MATWLVLAGWLCWSVVSVWGSECPWEETGLLKWSDTATWDDNTVPVKDSQVVIPANKRVLLDVQPASLATLTIEGALVWGLVDGLELNTHYIWVKGEFHIGSQACRFPLKANIRLHGNSKDAYEVKEHEFGRKFLGVAPNGTLEIHGRLRTSWTKLAQTVIPIHQVTCAHVYDHTNLTHNKVGPTSQQGVQVIVWNQDGSLMDFAIFKDYTEFGSFFTTIPKGKVIGMFVYGSGGINKMTQSLLNPIVALGASLIKSAKDKYGFSFIGRKGYSDTVKEVLRSDNSVDGEGTDFLSLRDDSKKLLFQVAVNPGTVKAFMMFRVLSTDAAYPKLTLVDEVKGWREGDEVVLASTDFNWEQAEVRKIVGCSKDDCNSRQIRVNASFRYMHFGNFTENVDERGEVAMLSRSIVIEGVMEGTCTERTQHEKDLQLCKKFNRDTFGGHVKVVRGFKAVRVRGVKLMHVGQQQVKGAYPLHFHMVDSARGRAYLRENTVMESFSRCFTVHGTDWLEVSDNVCYRHLGHGLFLEDAVEQNNLVERNIILGTMHGTILLSDRKKDWCSKNLQVYCNALSTFWLTHPNNEIKNNVAAGGEGIGFMYIFADRPLGPSVARQKELKRPHNPKTFPLRFTKNVAHSNKAAGVHMDEKISTGTGMENKGNVTENGVLRTENEYDPHLNGVPVWTNMSYGTYYKNGKNMWVKGGNIRVSFSALADAREGFTGGTTLFDSGTQLYKCILIGETDNTGQPSKRRIGGVLMHMNRSYYGEPNGSLTAVSAYQGPNIINSCFFDKYTTVKWCLEENKPVSACNPSKIVTRYSGAISFKRSNTYPTMTSSYAVNNTFGYCDNTDGQHWVFQGADGTADWKWKDGNRAVFMRDRDGMLTGTPNAAIVPNYQLYSGDECLLRPDWGNLLVCPYRYIKLEILGKGGNLSPELRTKYPLIITRDDSPYNVPFTEHMGEIRNEFLLRTNRSYIVDFNKTLTNGAFPSKINLFGYGVEKGDVIRVGICQPKDVKGFNITMFYPKFLKNNATWVDSLAKLDADTTGTAFFHNKTSGMLFFKVLSFHTDTNETQQCPDGHCWQTNIEPVGGTLTNMRTCHKLAIDSFKGKLGVKEQPTVPSCPGVSSPKGLGAIVWSKESFIEKKAYTVKCTSLVTPAGRNTATHKGCFKEKYNKVEQDLKTNEVLSLSAMNVDFCIDRCYHRGYKWAALARGSRCTCSHSLLDSPGYAAPLKNCNKACNGNKTQTCGAKDKMNVWTTGVPSS